MAVISEETEVKFKQYADLSYNDYGTDTIDLFVQDVCIGDIEVFTDRENEKREYICVNYEMIYLDTLRKRISK
jgi:hypothetical protein